MQGRIYQLDLLRFLAAFVVVLYHYTYRGFAADDMSVVAFPVLGEIFKYGYLGVDLFFMISGFVILMSAQSGSVRVFTISRIRRLYPAFWFAVGFTSLIVILFSDGRFSVSWSQFLANLTMLNGFFDVPHVDDVYWTLVIEIKFYALIALLILTKQIKHIERYLACWLILSLSSLHINLPEWIKSIFFVSWSSYFIAGSVLFLIKQNGLKLKYLVLLAVSYYLAIKVAYWRIPGLNFHFSNEYNPIIVLGTISLFFSTLLVISIGRAERINRSYWVSLGALTYPLYLIHHNAGFVLINYFSPYINHYALLIGLILSMCMLAHLMVKYVETPLSKLLKPLLIKLFRTEKAVTNI